MAAGDPTLVNHGVFTISGEALKTAVDGISPFEPLSGETLHFIPAGEGQINLLQIQIE